MQATKEQITEERVLGALYKNAKMGADAVIGLLPHVRDDALRSLMTEQLDGYEKYAARAESALTARGGEAKEENLLTRAAAKVGIAINTMIDPTASHIAEMMIEGSNMGITDATRLLNHYEAAADSAALPLAREMILFEERNLEMLKRFL